MEDGNLYRKLIYSKHFRRACAELLIFASVTGYVFYQSLYGVLFILLIASVTIKNRIHSLDIAEKQTKIGAFIDLLHVIRRLSASGLSILACFREAEKELINLYPDRSAWIITSLEDLNAKLMVDPYVGRYLLEWGMREGLRDISDFGQVMSVIQEYGGNMSERIGETALTISQRVETDRHIWVLASSKIFEQKVLYYLGYIMIIALQSVMPEMFIALYGTLIGRGVMTLSLLMMVIGRELGMKLTRIEV